MNNGRREAPRLEKPFYIGATQAVNWAQPLTEPIRTCETDQRAHNPNQKAHGLFC